MFRDKQDRFTSKEKESLRNPYYINLKPELWEMNISTMDLIIMKA